MLRAVIFAVTVSFLLLGTVTPPAAASDDVDVFDAHEEPEQGIHRLGEARKKAAARRKAAPEAPGAAFRAPEERIRTPSPQAADVASDERDRGHGRGHDEDKDKDKDDDRHDDHHGDNDNDDDDDDDDDDKKGKK